jgi:hypothetical protein
MIINASITYGGNVCKQNWWQWKFLLCYQKVTTTGQSQKHKHTKHKFTENFISWRWQNSIFQLVVNASCYNRHAPFSLQASILLLQKCSESLHAIWGLNLKAFFFFLLQISFHIICHYSSLALIWQWWKFVLLSLLENWRPVKKWYTDVPLQVLWLTNQFFLLEWLTFKQILILLPILWICVPCYSSTTNNLKLPVWIPFL